MAELANWRLDETTATTSLADSSGNGETATLVGSTADAQAVEGPGGTTQEALQFGTGIYANTPILLSELGSAGSIAGWVIMDDGYATSPLVGCVSNTFYFGVQSAGRVDFNEASSSSRIFSNTGLVEAGIPAHIAFTWNGSTIKLYCNNVEVASTSSLTPTWHSEALIIGRQQASTYFDGAAGNIYVFDHALTAGEIDTLYGEGIPQCPRPRTAPQVGLCRHRRLVSPLGTSLPFSVHTDGINAWTNLPRTHSMTPDATYYVDPATGSDGNAGTSEGAPLATLSAAIAKAGDRLVYAKGDFHHDDALIASGRFGGIASAAEGFVLLPWDGERIRLINGPAPSSLTWSASGGGVYTTTLPEASTINVVDEGTLDEFGFGTPLTPQADTGAVSSSGGWYRSDTTLTVKLDDGADPTSRVQVIADKAGQQSPQVYYTQPFWFEGVDLLGWELYMQDFQTTRPVNKTVKDCTIAHAVDDGLSAVSYSGDLYHLLNVMTAYSGTDNFNLDQAGIVVEENCVAHYAGFNAALDSAQQGSTSHTGTVVVRCGGIYQQSAGENIADVTGAESWNLFTTAQNSRSQGPQREMDFGIQSPEVAYVYKGRMGDSATERSLAGGCLDDGSVFSGTDLGGSYTQTFEAATSYGELIKNYAGTYTFGAITNQIQRADDASGTNAADISGATSLPYEVTTDDNGKYLRLAETATNSEGSATQYTEWIGPISAGLVTKGMFGSAMV